MSSRFSEFLSTEKIDPRRLLAVSRKLERLRPEDRQIRLKRRLTKGKDAPAADAAAAPPVKPRSGRAVTPRQLALATSGGALSGAHLQMIGQPYSTFANNRGEFRLLFDINLMADCRTQYVRIEAPGFRSQMLPIVIGGGVSTVGLRRR